MHTPAPLTTLLPPSSFVISLCAQFTLALILAVSNTPLPRWGTAGWGGVHSLLHFPDGFRQPAAGREQQGDSELGSGIRQDVWGVAHSDPTTNQTSLYWTVGMSPSTMALGSLFALPRWQGNAEEQFVNPHPLGRVWRWRELDGESVIAIFSTSSVVAELQKGSQSGGRRHLHTG